MANSPNKLSPRSDQNHDVSIETGHWHPFEQMRRQLEHFFQDDTNGPSLFNKHHRFDIEPFWSSDFMRIHSPAVDIVENEEAYEITAEVPGVDEKQLSVKVINGTLQLKGEKHDSREEKSSSYHLSERRYGSFERVFSLPKTVDAEHIKAVFKAGVLQVTLPKKAEAMQPEKTVDIAIE